MSKNKLIILERVKAGNNRDYPCLGCVFDSKHRCVSDLKGANTDCEVSKISYIWRKRTLKYILKHRGLTETGQI